MYYNGDNLGDEERPNKHTFLAREEIRDQEGTMMLVQDAEGAIVMIPLTGDAKLTRIDTGRYDARKIKKEVDSLRAKWR